MPGRATVYEWLDTNEEFSGQFHSARARGIHALAEECIEIADNQIEEPSSRRVRIDTRLRLAGKWLPKIYGDKVQHEAELHHTIALDEKQLPPALSFLARYSAAGGSGPDASTGGLVEE